MTRCYPLLGTARCQTRYYSLVGATAEGTSLMEIKLGTTRWLDESVSGYEGV